VLGTARIISFKDLIEARAKRNKQDAAKEAKGKGKRGHKRKAVVPEIEAEGEAEAEASQAGPAEPTAKKMRRSEGLDLEKQRVPVARMY
jgi:hypothetical protein